MQTFGYGPHGAIIKIYPSTEAKNVKLGPNRNRPALQPDVLERWASEFNPPDSSMRPLHFMYEHGTKKNDRVGKVSRLFYNRKDGWLWGEVEGLTPEVKGVFERGRLDGVSLCYQFSGGHLTPLEVSAVQQPDFPQSRVIVCHNDSGDQQLIWPLCYGLAPLERLQKPAQRFAHSSQAATAAVATMSSYSARTDLNEDNSFNIGGMNYQVPGSSGISVQPAPTTEQRTFVPMDLFGAVASGTGAPLPPSSSQPGMSRSSSSAPGVDIGSDMQDVAGVSASSTPPDPLEGLAGVYRKRDGSWLVVDNDPAVMREARNRLASSGHDIRKLSMYDSNDVESSGQLQELTMLDNLNSEQKMHVLEQVMLNYNTRVQELEAVKSETARMQSELEETRRQMHERDRMALVKEMRSTYPLCEWMVRQREHMKDAELKQIQEEATRLSYQLLQPGMESVRADYEANYKMMRRNQRDQQKRKRDHSSGNTPTDERATPAMASTAEEASRNLRVRQQTEAPYQDPYQDAMSRFGGVGGANQFVFPNSYSNHVRHGHLGNTVQSKVFAHNVDGGAPSSRPSAENAFAKMFREVVSQQQQGSPGSEYSSTDSMLSLSSSSSSSSSSSTSYAAMHTSGGGGGSSSRAGSLSTATPMTAPLQLFDAPGNGSGGGALGLGNGNYTDPQLSCAAAMAACGRSEDDIGGGSGSGGIDANPELIQCDVKAMVVRHSALQAATELKHKPTARTTTQLLFNEMLTKNGRGDARSNFATNNLAVMNPWAFRMLVNWRTHMESVPTNASAGILGFKDLEENPRGWNDTTPVHQRGGKFAALSRTPNWDNIRGLDHFRPKK